MVQGKTKGLQDKASSSRHASRAAAAPRKGRKYIPPKKATLIKQTIVRQACANISSYIILFLPPTSLKKLSAKINKSIERQMVNAATPGKLTIMKHVVAEE